MKKLIIAEKPSLALNILKSIREPFDKQQGYFESNQYIVSFAYGHLFGLIDIETYENAYSQDKGWTLHNLPFFPKQFQFDIKKIKGKHDAGAKKQFLILKELMNRNDVCEIVHCGDADREGEVIIRLIIQNGLSTNKKITRLWLPEQTEETIRHELNNLKSDSLYDNLYQEGLARTYIDWLYGINYTRLLTVKSGELFNVGRVLTPIVEAIHEKEISIKEFVPKKYLVIESNEETNGQNVPLRTKDKWETNSIDNVNNICEKYNTADAIVANIDKKSFIKSAGKLFSLSKLQGILGKKFKMSMRESLQTVQILYEKGFVTYPRTNTEYLSEKEKGKVQQLIMSLSSKGYEVKFKDTKRIFDDKKIESHSALIPTIKFPDVDLTGNEKIVYDTIFNRFLSVFCSEECIVEQTTMTVKCIDDFIITGNILKQKGFLKYENIEMKDSILPNLSVGDPVNHFFSPSVKETQAPKRYTVESLNNYLKSPFKKSEANSEANNDDDDYAAILSGAEIGTEATRTGIIENAMRANYISLKNNQYFLLPKGESVIHLLRELDIDMDKNRTIYLQQLLKSVYRGERNLEDVLEEVKKQIQINFQNKNTELSKSYKTEREIIGSCPKCGNSVHETNKAYSCSNKECNFALWKTGNRFLESIGMKMTKTAAAGFLSRGKVLVKGLKSKKDKTYDAYILVDFSGEYPQWKMEFPKKKEAEK